MTANYDLILIPAGRNNQKLSLIARRFDQVQKFKHYSKRLFRDRRISAPLLAASIFTWQQTFTAALYHRIQDEKFEFKSSSIFSQFLIYSQFCCISA